MDGRMLLQMAISMAMKTYSVAEAKNQLPKLIDRALAGEEVVITRRGKPVVELKQVPARPPVSKADRMTG